MSIAPTYRQPCFVALFVDALTGVPRNVSTAPSIVGKWIIGGPSLGDWSSDTMTSVPGVTGAYVYVPAAMTNDNFSYWCWPQWSDTAVRLAFFGDALFSEYGLELIDAQVSSRLESSQYTTPPSVAEIETAIQSIEMTGTGRVKWLEGLKALVDSLLSWSSSPGTATGTIALESHILPANPLNVTNCGGYCNNPGYLYVTLDSPLGSPSAASLTFYVDQYSQGDIAISLAQTATPDDGSGDYQNQSWGTQKIITPIPESLNTVDILDLVTELYAAAPGAQYIGILFSPSGGNSTVIISPLDEGNLFSLSIEQLIETPYSAADTKLDMIKAVTDSLDVSAVTQVPVSSAGHLTITAGLTFEASVTGLTIPSDWVTALWTLKRNTQEADTSARVQLRETNPGAGTDGLQRLNGSASLPTGVTAASGDLTVNQAGGSITVKLNDELTVLLNRSEGLGWDVKFIDSSGDSSGTRGTADIDLTETKAVV